MPLKSCIVDQVDNSPALSMRMMFTGSVLEGGAMNTARNRHGAAITLTSWKPRPSFLPSEARTIMEYVPDARRSLATTKFRVTVELIAFTAATCAATGLPCSSTKLITTLSTR